MDEEIRHSLIATAREEADRLNRLVGNLLNMTRLEAGAMRIHPEPCDVQDLIGSTLEQFGSRLEDRQVIIDLPQDLPSRPVGFCMDRPGAGQYHR